jgi:formylglycine-generating enzyme required for sulfatase activity
MTHRTEFKIRLFLTVALVLSVAGCSDKKDSPPKAGDTISNSLGMKLAYIPAGEFNMGSLEDEDGHNDDELQHHVIITKAFYIGTTEVTQSQWTKVVGFNRSKFKGDDLPVENMSWTDAVKFCEKLSEMEGKTYRLPTEAEWEYACRAGTTWAFGGTGNIDDMAWYNANSNKTTHPVAMKQPNAWGLYDMHGNIAEWCSDRYFAEYPDSTVTDPTGPDEGNFRVVRGGSWDYRPSGCRAAARISRRASYQLANTGLRIVMEISP